MASSQDAGPHAFSKRPFSKSDVSCHPDENWSLRVLMRGWVANVASVRDAAEFTVETMGAEYQSSDSVTDCQTFSADSSMDSMRAACGRKSHVPVCGSLNPGSSPLPSCLSERCTVSGW